MIGKHSLTGMFSLISLDTFKVERGAISRKLNFRRQMACECVTAMCSRKCARNHSFLSVLGA